MRWGRRFRLPGAGPARASISESKEGYEKRDFVAGLTAVNVDGHRLFVRCTGQPSEMTVILESGLGAGLESWKPAQSKIEAFYVLVGASLGGIYVRRLARREITRRASPRP